MTSLAGTYGFTADQGATFSQTVKWKDSTGSLIDLTGYSAEMVIRERTTAAPVALTLSTSNGRITLGDAAGTIDLLIADEDTANLDEGHYTYTLELTSSGGIVERVLMGLFVVRPKVFR